MVSDDEDEDDEDEEYLNETEEERGIKDAKHFGAI